MIAFYEARRNWLPYVNRKRGEFGFLQKNRGFRTPVLTGANDRLLDAAVEFWKLMRKINHRRIPEGVPR